MGYTPGVLGENICKYRTLKCLRQNQLSAMSGVSTAVISRLETGERQDMRCQGALLLADSLEVTVDELLRLEV